MINKAGGQAFPRSMDDMDGMTLRDYFAASSGVTWSDAVALATSDGTVGQTAEVIACTLAVMRGRVADAMLIERKE